VTIRPEYLLMAVDSLCKLLLTDKNPQIRAKAAESLGKIGSELAIPALCQALQQDTDINVRFQAADALVLIVNPESVKFMSETPKNQNSFNFNAPVGNINTGDVKIEGDQVGIQNNYAPTQNLTELIEKLEQLLENLPKNNPPQEVFIAELEEVIQTYPITSAEDKRLFNIQFQQSIRTKSQIAQILLQGGIELIKILCPPLGIPIEMGKKWLETAEKNK
jgi:HEAT repeats